MRFIVLFEPQDAWPSSKKTVLMAAASSRQFQTIATVNRIDGVLMLKYKDLCNISWTVLTDNPKIDAHRVDLCSQDVQLFLNPTDFVGSKNSCNLSR